MVKHIILWKLKEEFSEEEKKTDQSRDQGRIRRSCRSDPGNDRNQSAHRLSAEFNRGCHARFHI